MALSKTLVYDLKNKQKVREMYVTLAMLVAPNRLLYQADVR